MKIKLAVKYFIKYSLVRYILNFKKNDNKNYEFENIKNYWINNNLNNSNEEKVILISTLRDAHTLSNKLFSIIGMLGTKYKLKVIAVSDYGQSKAVYFLRNYCSNIKVESIYSFKSSLFLHFKTLVFIIRNFKEIIRLNDIKINNNNIADLVYDEYLRVTGLPTIKKGDLLYFSIVYNGVYLYYRYCELYNKYKITDVVLGLDIYTKAMHIRAGAEFGAYKWQTYNFNKPMSVRRTPCTFNYTFRPLIYEQKHSNLVDKLYKKDEVESLFDKIFKQRFSGNQNSSFHDKGVNDANLDKVNDFDKLISSLGSFYNPNHKTIVIFAHVFVDAVTSTGWSVYKDYYIWLIETLKICKLLDNVNILVKPHPLEKKYKLVTTAKEVVKKFNLDFNSKIGIIDNKFSNLNIINLSNVILTQTGSIGLEASSKGKIVICASANWYELANSVFKAQTLQQYKNLILNFDSLSINEDQIYEAKKCFIWNSYLMHADVDFVSSDIGKYDFKSLDQLYKNARSLKSQPVYKFIETNEYN